MIGIFTTVLEDNVKKGHIIRRQRGSKKPLQRVFCMVQNESERAESTSFVFVYEHENGTEMLWMARIILILKLSVQISSDTGDIAFICVLIL